MNSAVSRWLVLGLVVLSFQLVAPAAVPATAGSCEDRTAGSAPTTGAIFNDPAGTATEQYRISSRIRDNIAGTPPGAVIRLATHGINIPALLRALVRAHTCRVAVRVLVPGRAWQEPPVLELRRELGTDMSKRSWITRCDGACTTSGSKGIMHAKLSLFSEVVGGGTVTEDVTVYSSANLIHSQSNNRYNDAYQLVGNEDVHTSATRFFKSLAGNIETTYPELTKAPGLRQYFFPADQDFHRDVFERTKCRVDDGRTHVDFAASIWERLDVARQMVALEAAGCTVRLLLAVDRVDKDVLRELFRGGVPTRVQSIRAGDQAVHSKYIAIRGSHRGKPVSTVYAGSLNVSRYSSKIANNVMLRIVDDETDYLAYHRHFTGLWELSRPLRRSDFR